MTPQYRTANPPIFNIPGIILGALALIVGIHLIREYVLSPSTDFKVLIDFSLIPGCYNVPVPDCGERLPGANFWTPVTYALLHASWGHVAANALWLLAFGTPVARRLGVARFIAFSLAGALGASALFYIMQPTLLQPMIGASGVVSALMGGACRFALTLPGQLGSAVHSYAPRLTVQESLTNRTVLMFILIFFGTNLAIGSAGFAGGNTIAWEAHLGGFAVGFLLFGYFDPVRTQRFR
ncbi:rhomboid family intramembrane serine protease [Aureimonas fodinaquatilis]|uniref:rhomboid family intramembrane serine protease n=1 Tax=Aureimonas fodinaquatilis TaxID=2565783 RepID=UPI001FEA8CB7|nr:rhomboid family intramembrane serine protease [Aureimonas fodinaquatilis]